MKLKKKPKESHKARLLKREWWGKKKGTYPNVRVTFNQDFDVVVTFFPDEHTDPTTWGQERSLARLMAARINDALHEFRPGS